MKAGDDHADDRRHEAGAESPADCIPGSALTRREALQRVGRMAYTAPTVMVFSMSAIKQQGPGSPPPPPFTDPRNGP